MPVWLMKPPGVASPCCCVAASTSAHVAPPPQTARRATGSTATLFIAPRWTIIPPSQTACPA